MVQKIGKHGLEVRSGQIAGALEQRLDDLLLGREVRAENMRRGGRDRDDHAPVAAQALPPEARALTQCLGRLSLVVRFRLRVCCFTEKASTAMFQCRMCSENPFSGLL